MEVTRQLDTIKEVKSGKSRTLKRRKDAGHSMQRFTKPVVKKIIETSNDELLEIRIRDLQIKRDFEGPPLTRAEKVAIVELLYGDKITVEKAAKWTKEERSSINALLQRAYNSLAFDDLKRLIDQSIEPIAPATKNQIWEINHVRILWAIDSLTQNKNRFPTRSEISIKTELSRVTIDKHLKDYFGSALYLEKREEYLLMRENILSKAYKYGSDGDLRACKIFLEATNSIVESPKIRNQNNYLTINGMIISEDKLKALPPDKIKMITDIFAINPTV